VVDGLSHESFHRRPPGGGWSVAQCLEHLLVTDSRMVERLEEAIARARAEGRLASPEAAAAPARLGWLDRLFVHATGPGREGAKSPPMRSTAPGPYDPGDPEARARQRDDVLADYGAMQDRMTAAARAADGLDLAGIRVASAAAAWLKVSLAAWFVGLAGHHERHLAQARRTRAAVTTRVGGGS
jgi:hypothetical protein